ncbi:MAG: 1-acyl-sn-glycerol-3-phosphate acyltransferase, partial [Bacteroidota bacterium]
LRILYHFFKLLVRVGTWIYYSKITVQHGERSKISGACIVISNHPSTVLDPLNAAVRMQRIVFFLANSGLFKNPVAGWLLNKLYCIPVERQKDVPGRAPENSESLERATSFLTGGGCLYIAPEGNSYVERRLRKMKTGTARIAFAAESRNDFKLGLTILPIGLNYSSPTEFRSHLLTIFGEPVQVADFQKDWETDPVEGVRKFTAYLGERLSDLLIDTLDDAEDALLNRLEVLLQNENRLPNMAHFQRTKAVQAHLQALRASDEEAFGDFEKQVAGYFEKLEALKISDLALILVFRNLQDFGKLSLRLAALFPAFLLGYASNFLPCFFSKKINDWLNDDLSYVPTFKFLAGIVFFPIFWGLQIWLVSRLTPPLGGWGVWTWLYLASLIPSGLAAERFLKDWKLRLESRRVKFLRKEKPAEYADLQEKRKEILASGILNWKETKALKSVSL